MKSFKFYKQLDQMDCGSTCLRMIAKHHGRNFNSESLRQLCEVTKAGVSLLGISNAAEKMAFRSLGTDIECEDLPRIDLPCILHWKNNHFVVLYKVKKRSYYIADPALGLLKLNKIDFEANWLKSAESSSGVALLLSPTPAFYDQEEESTTEIRWTFVFRYLIIYRQLIFQLLLGLGIGSLLQLATPFITQSIVDIGINPRNLDFIYLILIAQATLVIGRVSVEFIRSWILLHISTRINISILTDFLIKLMNLPIAFFDSKMTGDIMQRMNDQRRIENFLTGPALSTLFSLVNLIVFSVVIAYYNTTIFLVFVISSAIYIGWITAFLNRRRVLDYHRFDIAAQNQSSIIQLVSGMQEIKINGCEQQLRWEWEHLQARLFKFNIKNLTLSQYQQGGSTLINEVTNMLIIFFSAKAVINGNLTLGGMMAMQYIIGQLNAPVQQFLSFIQSFQDAKISLERLNEIHQMKEEEPLEKELSYTLPANRDIKISNLTFKYPGAGNVPVLNNISMLIPEGKTTAIVGTSGSGKTTILKILLRFYCPDQADINVGGEDLKNISFKAWRKDCGVVMQDGFIFSNTVARNIAVGEDYPDKNKLKHAIKVANIQDFVDGLPLGLNTKIGSAGSGLSNGQRQRILIARAVYKDPHYIFFDEATNSLDANNEKVIMENLKEFFGGRTVVIVAHRLSTVRNADNIIVLDRGNIIEQGNHLELSSLKGDYYKLIKNQLELD